MAKEQGGSLFSWAKGLLRRGGTESLQLNLHEEQGVAGVVPDHARPASGPEGGAPAGTAGRDAGLGHDTVRFTDQKTGRQFFGHAVQFLPGMRHESIEPGSHDLSGAAGIWANDNQLGATIDWIDDPQAGLFAVPIHGFKEVLGRAGILKGVPYLFKDILQVGKNVVVYKLESPNGTKGAIGLGRNAFDPLYGLVTYLRKVGTGQGKYSTSRVIALSDLVLAILPEDETALFNKGAALMMDGEFERSHWCFQKLVEVKPGDQLAILHDAAVLAKLGQDTRAVEQFLVADSISEEQCRETLVSLPSLREPLYELVRKRVADDPESSGASVLWQKYFALAADPS